VGPITILDGMSDDAAGLMAGVLCSFTREVADTPLLLVPQVCVHLLLPRNTETSI
jgi:hypothetical protein